MKFPMNNQCRNTPPEFPVERLIEHIGHDFNNLFSIIIGGLSLLRDEIPADAWNNDLQITYEDILSATRDGTELIEKLNTWAGRQLLVPALTDVNRLLLDLKPVLEYSLGRNLRLVLDLHPEPLPALVDTGALHQCLGHLLSNAREAMPNGGILEISSCPGPCIEIRDQGEGMSQDTLRQCTQPFFTTRKASGKQGLGLAVVTGFARASGGRLEIHSEINSGTRARLVLTTAENS